MELHRKNQNPCKHNFCIISLVSVFQLQAQSERMVKINIELRRKNQNHRKHARTLIGEKVNLEMQLAEKEQQVTQVTVISV